MSQYCGGGGEYCGNGEYDELLLFGKLLSSHSTTKMHTTNVASIKNIKNARVNSIKSCAIKDKPFFITFANFIGLTSSLLHVVYIFFIFSHVSGS